MLIGAAGVIGTGATGAAFRRVAGLGVDGSESPYVSKVQNHIFLFHSNFTLPGLPSLF